MWILNEMKLVCVLDVHTIFRSLFLYRPPTPYGKSSDRLQVDVDLCRFSCRTYTCRLQDDKEGGDKVSGRRDLNFVLSVTLYMNVTFL